MDLVGNWMNLIYNLLVIMSPGSSQMNDNFRIYITVTSMITTL